MKFVTGEAGEQGSPAWHELRRTKIGASASPALLGLSPYKTGADVFREMVLGEVGYINKAMVHGSNTEQEARDYFNKINPNLAFRPAVVVSEEYDIMMCSLDGINETNTTILEIKVPGEKVYDLCLQE
jgi:putative phage-type endonuclease